MSRGPKIEALHLVALSIEVEAKRKRGDSEGAAKAQKLHDEAVRIWKKQLADRQYDKSPYSKCPYCGKRP